MRTSPIPYSTRLAGAIWRAKRREEAVLRLAAASLRQTSDGIENYVASLALAVKEMRVAKRELATLMRSHG